MCDARRYRLRVCRVITQHNVNEVVWKPFLAQYSEYTCVIWKYEASVQIYCEGTLQQMHLEMKRKMFTRSYILCLLTRRRFLKLRACCRGGLVTTSKNRHEPFPGRKTVNGQWAPSSYITEDSLFLELDDHFFEMPAGFLVFRKCNT